MGDPVGSPGDGQEKGRGGVRAGVARAADARRRGLGCRPIRLPKPQQPDQDPDRAAPLGRSPKKKPVYPIDMIDSEFA
jgi:hypothetical protein